MSRTDSTQSRRWLGSHYTPDDICCTMVQEVLSESCSERSGLQTSLRILDPACGDGAFLLAAAEWLEEWYLSHSNGERPLRIDQSSRHTPCAAAGSGRHTECACYFPEARTHTPLAYPLDSESSTSSSQLRLQLVSQHLYGVDVDPEAVSTLHRRLLDYIAPDQPAADQTLHAVQRNVRVGDALTGPDFRTRNASLFAPDGFAGKAQTSAPISWAEVFPEVAEAGGFDVVIGNPPYVREKNAKELFDRIAETPLGRQWRQARMDLWHYFVHRGLDLLRPDGYLSFIVNSYWTASWGARKLIRRLDQETTLKQVTLLGNTRLFRNVAGRHMIFRLQKERRDTSCRIVDRSEDARSGRDEWELAQGDLFVNDKLVLSARPEWIKRLDNLLELGSAFDVRQGMAENPPTITQRLANEFPEKYCAGEGVFVLTQQEVDHLDFTAEERKLLRPYYENGGLGRYGMSSEPTHFVLYLSRHGFESLDPFPRVLRHLSRFRPILERRRECRKGTIPWWQLHWPREERIFTEPRILNLQMGRRPQFVWSEPPTYVGFSVNLIVQRAGCPLAALTGILNSSLARCWFEMFGKRRGVHLEISGTLLRRFPLPHRDQNVEEQLAQLVEGRQSLAMESSREEIGRIEHLIDEAVCRLYGLDPARVYAGSFDAGA